MSTTETDTELDPEACTNENDVTTTYMFDDGTGAVEGFDQDLLYLPVGASDMEIESSVVMYGCPIERNITVQIDSVLECTVATAEADCGADWLISDWQWQCQPGPDTESEFQLWGTNECVGFVCNEGTPYQVLQSVSQCSMYCENMGTGYRCYTE